VRLRVLRLVAGTGDDLQRRVGESGVDEAAPDVPRALRPGGGSVLVGVGALGDRLHEAPECIGGESERHRDQDELPERVVRELRERPFAARRLAAVAERELRGQHPDEPEGETLRDEPGAREHGVPATARICLLFRLVPRFTQGAVNCRHAYTSIVAMAPVNETTGEAAGEVRAE
jgi:hypothetical protein